MSTLEAFLIMVSAWAVLAVLAVGASMCACKKRTGKWWR